MISDIDGMELRPIRSSTPTPSIGTSTILAGNIDVSLDGHDLDTSLEQMTTADDNFEDLENDELFKPYMEAALRRSNMKATARKNRDTPILGSSKNNYCSDWIEKNEGVCTNNLDAPPSLYEPSVALSDSLLNVTSVSRNVTPQAETKGKTLPKATTSLEKYKNTVFM